MPIVAVVLVAILALVVFSVRKLKKPKRPRISLGRRDAALDVRPFTVDHAGR